MPKTVVLDNATLDSLAANPQARAQLPQILNAIYHAKLRLGPGCARCNRAKENQALRRAYSQVKQAIPALSATSRTLLKSLLNADQIQVHVLDVGQAKPYTF